MKTDNSPEQPAKPVSKGCLGCLGVLALLFILVVVGLIIGPDTKKEEPVGHQLMTCSEFRDYISSNTDRFSLAISPAVFASADVEWEKPILTGTLIQQPVRCRDGQVMVYYMMDGPNRTFKLVRIE